MMLARAQAHAAPLADRKDDLYETPPEATRALLSAEPLPHVIWEPAGGRGAIVNVLRAAGHVVIASDLVDYSIPGQATRRDFLMERSAPPEVRAIVTNPPYKLAAEFVDKALMLAPLVVMLLRLQFLEGGNGDRRVSALRRKALDGGQLARVHLFRNRIPRMHRDGWEGRQASSSIAFAWFVWDREHKGPTELHRISWGAYDGARDFDRSINACYEAVRERVAAGGEGWGTQE